MRSQKEILVVAQQQFFLFLRASFFLSATSSTGIDRFESSLMSGCSYQYQRSLSHKNFIHAYQWVKNNLPVDIEMSFVSAPPSEYSECIVDMGDMGILYTVSTFRITFHGIAR
jgi:hypothetical protein